MNPDEARDSLFTTETWNQYKCTMCKKFEDNKEAIRSRNSKKDRQHNVQKKKNKKRSTKYYIEN
jgi:hypothetical protein